MKLYYRSFLNFLFPLSDDEQLIQDCTAEQFSNKLHVVEQNMNLSLSQFADVQVKAALHLNKFHGHQHARRLLAALLHAWLKTLPRGAYVLIPVPLASQRQQKRGFNQVTEVCRLALQGLENIELAETVLVRSKDTPPQTSLAAAQRRVNLKNAFALKNSDGLSDKTVLLIDDVYTTGSTLTECATVLSNAGIPCTRVAFAH